MQDSSADAGEWVMIPVEIYPKRKKAKKKKRFSHYCAAAKSRQDTPVDLQMRCGCRPGEVSRGRLSGTPR